MQNKFHPNHIFKGVRILIFEILIIFLLSNNLCLAQQGCSDRFLKNAYSLLKQKKISDALETFNEIVRNFPDCPEAEESEYQLILYFSREARRNNHSSYYQLAKEHINFYLFKWPNGGYRSSVLKEREFNKKSQKVLKIDKTKFLVLTATAIIVTFGFGIANKASF